MDKYEQIKNCLREKPRKWVVTGVAGFIGSNLLETLLNLNQKVVGLDNFSTGKIKNIDEVRGCVSEEKWRNFIFVEGDIRKLETCERIVDGSDHVLHQAALGSVPRSIDNPLLTNENNITGHLNMLVAARDAGVKSLVYAASSSTYGDHPGLPKIEDVIGNPLSPYAITKYVNELYSNIFSQTYGFNSVGLRYFNVFGKRQDPDGAYAAVIPKWTSAMIKGETVFINGDGETSRDFCYVDNAVQANLLASLSDKILTSEVFNVALGDRTTLNQLFTKIRAELNSRNVAYSKDPEYRDFRIGDVKHSQASIEKANVVLGYTPEYRIDRGIATAMPWYIETLS